MTKMEVNFDFETLCSRYLSLFYVKGRHSRILDKRTLLLFDFNYYYNMIFKFWPI